MKPYRMVTPVTADAATLRWVADHADAIADQDLEFAAIVTSHPDEVRLYERLANQARNLARSMRHRAGRIEGKQKRARGRRHG